MTFGKNRKPLTRKKPMNRVSKKKLAQGSKTWNGAMGPSVKPRKRLRAKSKRNSNRHVDLKFRREYMAENFMCEMLPYFPKGEPPFPWISTPFVAVPMSESSVLNLVDPREATDPHHILWGQARRHDIRANLLAICREAHDFCHKFKVDGMALALEAKRRKGELDWSELNRISRMDVKGWLSTKRPVFDWVQPLWQAVLAA